MAEIIFQSATPIYDQLRIEQLQRRYRESAPPTELDTDELEIIIAPPPRIRKKTRGGKPIQ